jgi:hypothetical protein
MAALPAQFCPAQPALDHDKLAPGAQCPFCYYTGPPVHLALRPTEVTPTAPSQYTPLTPGAVNAQLRATALARKTSVTPANAYRGQAIARATAETSASPKVPTPFLFTVKVAWAEYSDADPPMTTWKRFNEHTTVAILHNACISFDTMKETFRQQLQAQPAPYFAVITGPKGHGHWTLASNHLGAAAANAQPNLITPWPGEFRIQDVITFTNWREDKGQYNATLLFYPQLPNRDVDTFSFRSLSVAFGDDSIIPKGRARSWKDPKPPTPSPTFEPYNGLDDVPPQEPISQDKGRNKGKDTHKRTISAAIPSTERVAGRAHSPSVVQAIVKAATRKSARGRKPKKK